MDLIACPQPTVALDSAPPTGLRQNTDSERWEGFWGEDDSYYVRLTHLHTGAMEWFRLADSRRDDVSVGSGSPAPPQRPEPQHGIRGVIVAGRGSSNRRGMLWIRRRKTG